MSNPLEPEQPFRFFDLPRELRDQIYYHSSKSTRKSSISRNGRNLHVESYVCGEPELSPTLVNRQFRTEYLKRIYETMTLAVFISSGKSFLGSFVSGNLLPLLQRCVIHFSAELKHGPKPVSEQIMTTGLHSLNQGFIGYLPGLRKLELRIGIHWDCQDKPEQIDWLNECDLSEIVAKIKKDTTVDQRDSLEVAICEQPCERGSWLKIEQNEGKAFATWTRKTGWDFGKDTQPHKQREDSANGLRLAEPETQNNSLVLYNNFPARFFGS